MGKMSAATIIMIFVALLIGVTLLPTFADQVTANTNTSISNVTGAANTVTGLLTLFFALVILLAAVKWGISKR